MAEENDNNEKKSIWSKILFIVGVIVILIILAVLVVTFVPRIFNGIANIGSSISSIIGGNSFAVSADKTSLKDDDTFTLVWDRASESAGSYAIQYDCVDEVYFDLITDNGTRRLICENTFTLGPNVTNATLRIHFDKTNAFTDVPLTILFTESGAIDPTARGEITVTVQEGTPGTDVTNGDLSDGDVVFTATSTAGTPTADTPTPITDKPTITTTPTYTQPTPTYNSPTPTYQSPADLAIYDVVTIGATTVQFTVANRGGQNSGNWYFNYSTPTNVAQVATSPLQISLAPGQAVRYTLNFFVRDAGTQVATIAVDPFNQIAESNENNNLASITFSGNTGGGGTGGTVDGPDFVLERLKVGRLSGNNFTEDDTVDEGDDVALSFRVRNTGDQNTNTWRFEVESDDASQFDYRSSSYPALRPGEYRDVIIEFDNVREGDYDIRVTADSDDDTDEDNENNNDDEVMLDVRD